MLPELKHHENGGEYIALTIPRAVGVASTSDGRYFLRVGDTCRPIVGDEVMRLADERPATPWEGMTSLGVTRANADVAKVDRICAGLRASDRVKPSVKEKTDDELLAHYGLASGDLLTNLGVLLVGRSSDQPAAALADVYPALMNHAMHHFKSPDVMRFLGKKAHGNFTGELTTSFKDRPEGVRVKHWTHGNSVKWHRISTTSVTDHSGRLRTHLQQDCWPLDIRQLRTR